jgi:uncharacterized protein YkwD
MKKQFKKSYKLGISAGILSALISVILSAPLLPLWKDALLPPLISNASFIFLLLFVAIGEAVLVGIFFIAFINLLPSSNIFVKFFVFSAVFSILSFPTYFSTGFSLLTNILISLASLTIYPLIYYFSYILIAKKMSGIIRFNTVGFSFIIGIILFITMVTSFVFVGIDTYRLATDVYENGNQTDFLPNINESSIEREIFNIVNQKRIELGNEPLIWNNDLNKIAKDYSAEISQTGSFSHINDEGESFSDRLKQSHLFYIVAAETLSGIPANTENPAESAVDNWLESPGHRSVIVDRDKFYTHLGTGVSCKFIYCYIVANFAKFDILETGELYYDRYLPINLNDAGLGLEASYPVVIQVNASRPVDIYFFNSEDQIDQFLYENEDNSRYRVFNRKQLSTKLDARQDSYMAIFPTADYPEITKYTYSLKYNRGGSR